MNFRSRYEVLMYDKGDPTQTGTATCLVGYVEITTTTVTTTTVATTTAAWSLFGDPLGIAMFVLALLAGLALLGLLTWLCLRFCCGGGNFCGGGGETRCCQSRYTLVNVYVDLVVFARIAGTS